MKTTKTLLNITLLLVFLLSNTFTAFSQQRKGNGNIVKEEREMNSFNAIEVGGAFDVYLTQGEPQSVNIETDENLLDNIKITVNNSRLVIKSNNIKSYTKLNVYITVPEISFINASGASSIEGENTITAGTLRIEASGATDI